MKSETLMLAQKHNPKKFGYCGYLASEKLDGIRCFWDGGVSRGIPCTEVPYANTQRDTRYKSPPIATGLWTRYLKPIQAPEWFLDSLPHLPLDGELTLDGNWQRLSSCIKDLVPGEDWANVRYAVFDSPPIFEVFGDRNISNNVLKKKLFNCVPWVMDRASQLSKDWNQERTFSKVLFNLKQQSLGECSYLLGQEEITSASGAAAKEQVTLMLEKILAGGGEGLILRSPISFWKPERSWSMLKLKGIEDMEGTVISYSWGRATDTDKSISGESTDRLVGLMGSIHLKLDSGVEFDLASGFTLPQRHMTLLDGTVSDAIYASAVANQGERVAPWIHNPLFPRGMRITFRYRELTDKGLPKEGRYFRKGDN